MSTYTAVVNRAILLSVFLTGCNAHEPQANQQQFDTSNLPAVGENHIESGAGGNCTTDADCISGTCVVEFLGIGPVGYCYDDSYVWCTTLETPAANEFGSSCTDEEVFAMCQPQTSAVIDSFCRPAKAYNPGTEYFRYSCCALEMFGTSAKL